MFSLKDSWAGIVMIISVRGLESFFSSWLERDLKCETEDILSFWTLEGATQLRTVWGVSPVISMQIWEHERSQVWDCCWGWISFWCSEALAGVWVGLQRWNKQLLDSFAFNQREAQPAGAGGTQSPEEQNQVGDMGNLVLGFCVVNNDKQSGWNGGNF